MLRAAIRSLLLAAILLALADVCSAAEEVTSAVLMSGASINDTPQCSILSITFSAKVSYLGHVPLGKADELHIKLAPVAASGKTAVADQESLHAPSSEQAAVQAIELAYDSTQATLAIYFKREVLTAVTESEDRKHILVAIAPQGAQEPCSATTAVHAAPAQGSAAELEPSVDPMSPIRTAILNGDLTGADQLLAQARNKDDSRYAQELEELAAMILEKSGQTQAALGAYRTYLTHYPTGDSAARVRAKLDALQSSGGANQNANLSGFTAPVPASGKPISDGAIIGNGRQPITSAPPPEQSDPDAWTITQGGSASLFYYRNEGGRDVFLPPRLQPGWDKESVYRLYQNSVIGTLDYDAHFERGTVDGRMRFSSAREQDFISGDDNLSSIYAANISLGDKSSGVAGTIGRQTLYTGGVLGRFDGVLASFKPTDEVKLSAVAGSPVWRGSDAPFQDSTYFWGVSAGLEKLSLWDVPIEPSVYYFHQQSDGFTDREAIGASLAAQTDTSSIWALTDFDVNYAQLNQAAMSASYMFPNRALASISADYRRAPLIFTSNSLQGQPVATLSDLLKIYSTSQIEQLALDRSAQSFTLDVNYTLPIGEDWQIIADGYVSYMGSTPESGGVPAMLSTGTDFYGYAQLSRYNLFSQGDSHSLALRFGDTSYDNLYAVEFSARYPVTTDWTIGPNIRAGFSAHKADSGNEIQFMPSLHVGYRIKEDVTLELEAGKKWIERDTPLGTARETELMALAGIRYDFYPR